MVFCYSVVHQVVTGSHDYSRIRVPVNMLGRTFIQWAGRSVNEQCWRSQRHNQTWQPELTRSLRTVFEYAIYAEVFACLWALTQRKTRAWPNRNTVVNMINESMISWYISPKYAFSTCLSKHANQYKLFVCKMLHAAGVWDFYAQRIRGDSWVSRACVLAIVCITIQTVPHMLHADVQRSAVDPSSTCTLGCYGRWCNVCMLDLVHDSQGYLVKHCNPNAVQLDRYGCLPSGKGSCPYTHEGTWPQHTGRDAISTESCAKIRRCINLNDPWTMS